MSDAPRSRPFDAWFAWSSEPRHASGSIEAEVTELFDQYRQRLFRYLCSLGMIAQDGEEIVQEVFLLLFQYLRNDKGRENLRGWIFRVAHHLALKKKAYDRKAGALSDSELEPADPRPTPEEQHAARQRTTRLRSVLDALPQQDQFCLYLRAEGLRYREIAEVLNISLGGVSKSLTRAIVRLNNADTR